MTSTPRSLEDLPTEILQFVVLLLDVRDICNLRLVSQTLATISSEGEFKALFTSKTVIVTSRKQLGEFVSLTQPKWLGCLLQSLTLVSTASAPRPEHLSNKKTCEKLLVKAFTNLRLNTAQGGLQCLTLGVRGRTEDGEIVSCDQVADWRASCNTAARVLEITMDALGKSVLPIRELDLFGSVPRCSLACNCIAPVLEMASSGSLQGLKRLTLNLSSHITQNPEEDESLRSSATGQRHASDICRFLRLCPQLEALELRWYHLKFISLNEAEAEETRFLTSVVQLEQLSRLHDCRLRGIYTDETTLLALLQKTKQLQRFTMENITLMPGTFKPAFKYLTNHMPHLEYLHSDNLQEGRPICFDGPGKPHYLTTSSADNRPMTLTRAADDLASRRRAIGYRPMTGAPRGSAAFSNWIRRKTMFYGCPDFHTGHGPIRFLA